jgi:predicted 3-demethylubiquinone-9 3-methyltransferase (glyoxalase superfamily)
MNAAARQDKQSPPAVALLVPTLSAGPKITPFLWFNMNAQEAVALYTSVFKNSRITNTTHYGEGAPVPAGTVMTIAFELDGQKLIALNGGPMYRLNEAFSLVVSRDSQAEIDDYWDSLTADGGAPQACGWLKDRFGLSWQIVPSNLSELVSGPNAPRVMQALFQMIKLDAAKLKAAADGRWSTLSQYAPQRATPRVYEPPSCHSPMTLPAGSRMVATSRLPSTKGACTTAPAWARAFSTATRTWST